MPTLPDWAIQMLQVLAILALAPLVTGVSARAEAIIRKRRVRGSGRGRAGRRLFEGTVPALIEDGMPVLVVNDGSR